MARDYTPLPFEYLEEMDHLSDAEYGRLIRGLQQFSITGEEPELSGQEKGHWKRVRNREIRYQESFDEADKARSKKASNAANARWHNAKNAQACSSMHKHSEQCSKCLTEAEAEAETNTETEANFYIPPPPAERARDAALKPVIEAFEQRFGRFPTQI